MNGSHKNCLDEFLGRRPIAGAATVIMPATRKRAGGGGHAAPAVRRDAEITRPVAEETWK